MVKKAKKTTLVNKKPTKEARVNITRKIPQKKIKNKTKEIPIHEDLSDNSKYMNTTYLLQTIIKYAKEYSIPLSSNALLHYRDITEKLNKYKKNDIIMELLENSADTLIKIEAELNENKSNFVQSFIDALDAYVTEIEIPASLSFTNNLTLNDLVKMNSNGKETLSASKIFEYYLIFTFRQLTKT